MSDFKLDEGVKQSWLQALRSGRYKQGHGKLVNGDAFCCLGVLRAECGFTGTPVHTAGSCDIGWLDNKRLSGEFIPLDVQEFLMELNDHDRWTFKQIADFIDLTF